MYHILVRFCSSLLYFPFEKALERDDVASLTTRGNQPDRLEGGMYEAAGAQTWFDDVLMGLYKNNMRYWRV